MGGLEVCKSQCCLAVGQCVILIVTVFAVTTSGKWHQRRLKSALVHPPGKPDIKTLIQINVTWHHFFYIMSEPSIADMAQFQIVIFAGPLLRK